MAALETDKASIEISPGDLCVQCGMCCDGSIFADVRLQPEDDPVRLAALGLVLKGAVLPSGSTEAETNITPTRPQPRAPVFPQPCAMLQGCRCTIYAERPAHCRK